MVSEKDIQSLVDHGYTDSGYILRQEFAEMYDEDVDYLDCLVLGRIRRLRKSSYSRLNVGV